MTRKKWVPKTEVTPALTKSREKRKWQIAFRRYVVDKQPSPTYAPYFGLDIPTLRKWVELSFEDGLNWDVFGKKWQFEHIIPVTFFDFSLEEDLKLCWNFVNIRVELIDTDTKTSVRPDILAAKEYFKQIHVRTGYKLCLALVEKLSRLEYAATNTAKQEAFILEHLSYLDMLENYSAFEFELLNSGRTADEVAKEVAFLKKF